MEREIMRLLREWVKTPEGQKTLADNGFGGTDTYDAEYLRSLAAELRNDINEAFAEVTRGHHKLTENFSSAEIIKISISTTARKGVTIKLQFPDIVLGRLSIAKANGDWEDPKSYFGRTYHNNHMGLYGNLDERFGVYDILGLFTQGYSIGKLRPKGSWVSAETWEVGAEIGITEVATPAWALERRGGSPFIRVTIEAFIQKHSSEFPELRVLYPKEWGGTL